MTDPLQDPAPLAELKEIERLDDIRRANWDPIPGGDLFSERRDDRGHHVEAAWGVAHRRDRHIDHLMQQFEARYGIHPLDWSTVVRVRRLLTSLGWSVKPPKESD